MMVDHLNSILKCSKHFTDFISYNDSGDMIATSCFSALFLKLWVGSHWGGRVRTVM